MGKKSKAPPKVDTSSSTKYLEKYTPTSYRTDLGPLGGQVHGLIQTLKELLLAWI